MGDEAAAPIATATAAAEDDVSLLFSLLARAADDELSLSGDARGGSADPAAPAAADTYE